MKYWGKWGAFWGGFWGLLFGAAFFWVPAIGPVLVGGPLAAWIVAGLEDAVVVGGAVVAHRRMPLSLSFDHRCITGGEACRFLATVITDLERSA